MWHWQCQRLFFKFQHWKLQPDLSSSWCAFALSSSKMKVKLFQVWLYKDGTTTTILADGGDGATLDDDTVKWLRSSQRKSRTPHSGFILGRSDE